MLLQFPLRPRSPTSHLTSVSKFQQNRIHSVPELFKLLQCVQILRLTSCSYIVVLKTEKVFVNFGNFQHSNTLGLGSCSLPVPKQRKLFSGNASLHLRFKVSAEQDPQSSALLSCRNLYKPKLPSCSLRKCKRF